MSITFPLGPFPVDGTLHSFGGSLGPLAHNIFVEQFTRTRNGDSFWYERSGVLDADVLAEVKQTTLVRFTVSVLWHVKKVTRKKPAGTSQHQSPTDTSDTSTLSAERASCAQCSLRLHRFVRAFA